MASVKDLFDAGQITRCHYQSYLLFEDNDLGKEWLKEIIHSTFLEEVPPIGEFCDSRQVGRVSLLQDISRMIMDVKNLMERHNDNGRTEVTRREVTTEHRPEVVGRKI